MTVIKDGIIRREEIIMAARGLFINKGYDKTSVNDILNIVNIAKGTFYYYFSSKAEVLESIVTNIVDEGILRAEYKLKDKTVPLLNRFILVIMGQRPEFEGSDVIKEEMHKVENTKLERLYLREMIKRLTPILEELIIEGIDQNIFKTDYPREAIESILLLGHMMFDWEVFQWNIEEYPIKIKAFLTNMEKILGTKEGELDIFLQMFQQS